VVIRIDGRGGKKISYQTEVLLEKLDGQAEGGVMEREGKFYELPKCTLKREQGGGKLEEYLNEKRDVQRGKNTFCQQGSSEAIGARIKKKEGGEVWNRRNEGIKKLSWQRDKRVREG